MADVGVSAPVERRRTELGKQDIAFRRGTLSCAFGNVFPLVGCCCRGRCLGAERHVDRIRRHGLRAAVLCAARRGLVPFGIFGVWDTVDALGVGTGDAAWWWQHVRATGVGGSELGVCSWTVTVPTHAEQPVLDVVINTAWCADAHPLRVAPRYAPEPDDVTTDNCAPEHVALVAGCLPVGTPYRVSVRACADGGCALGTHAELWFVRD